MSRQQESLIPQGKQYKMFLHQSSIFPAEMLIVSKQDESKPLKENYQIFP